MRKNLRYGDFLGAVRLRQRAISFNALARVEQPKRRPRLRALDMYRLITPYLAPRLLDQLRAVLPVALFLAIFQLLVLRSGVQGPLAIALGIAAVMAGLMCFMEGVRLGLMPFAENIGYLLPQRARMPSVLGIAFALGVLATLAEPAIGALKAAGSLTDPARAPLLARLLDQHSGALVWAVGGGVGAAVVLGILRVVYGLRMKSIVILSLIPCLALTGWFAADPLLAPVAGLAWDCGAITTGPVTVPLVLALGIGVANAAGEEDNPLCGFGIVTLASLFPAIAVMLLALGVSGEAPVAAVVAAAPAWHEQTPYAEIVGALRAILPLTLFLWLVQRVLLQEKLKDAGYVGYGIVMAVLGMLLFNLGLAWGLAPLGTQAGSLVPAAFAPHPAAPEAPLYGYAAGVAAALVFAGMLGLGATLAEPALLAMGITVETLTDGAFRRNTLVYTVAAGVAIGTALGVAKIVFDLPLAMLLLPAYLLALAMTVLSSEEYVNLAWDSAGVTTGPVTVPLVLALGLGLGKSVNAVDGFGVLAMASAGPIVSVLAMGLWIRLREARELQQGAELETAAS
ncbi:MAG: DUF1538 domain-containing protein [Betaproteobacteria bacterium]|nr:MAG: DUF1538 domain-containing protein [Betaproteobacteria bacterium]